MARGVLGKAGRRRSLVVEMTEASVTPTAADGADAAVKVAVSDELLSLTGFAEFLVEAAAMPWKGEVRATARARACVEAMPPQYGAGPPHAAARAGRADACCRHPQLSGRPVRAHVWDALWRDLAHAVQRPRHPRRVQWAAVRARTARAVARRLSVGCGAARAQVASCVASGVSVVAYCVRLSVFVCVGLSNDQPCDLVGTQVLDAGGDSDHEIAD